MLIACPNCDTSYDLEASSLGRAGRSVRCVRCRHVWFAANPRALTAVAQSFRDDVGLPGEEPASTLTGDANRLPVPEDAMPDASVASTDSSAVPSEDVAHSTKQEALGETPEAPGL